jgi:hypothetical protein
MSPQSLTNNFRRSAVWLFPLVFVLHWVLLLRLVALPVWAGGAILVALVGYGVWLRSSRQSLRSVLIASCILASYIGFEVFGRAMWHLYVLTLDRADLVIAVSFIFLLLFCAIVAAAFARGQKDHQAALSIKGEFMDRVAVQRASPLFWSGLGAGLAVLIVSVARPLLQTPFWQLIVFIGSPILIGTFFAVALGNTLGLLRAVGKIEASRGFTFKAPPLS